MSKFVKTIFFLVTIIYTYTTAQTYNIPKNKNALIKELSSINFYFEQYPPYAYKNNNRLSGTSIDILYKIMNFYGIKKSTVKINLGLWSRIYNLAQKKHFKNAILTMIYTNERSKLFNWIGPISELRLAIICNKKKHYDLNSSEINYAAVKLSMGGKWLLERKISPKNIKLYSQFETIQFDKVDCFSFSLKGAKFLLTKMGYNFNKDFSVYVISDIYYIYIATNKSIPHPVVDLMQTALEKLQ